MPTRQRTRRGASERQLVEAIFRRYGLPGWLGWGTYGAESSYGAAGEYKFGGIDLPQGNTASLPIAARESAKAYQRLVKQYGSVAAAVPHYSGNSYTVAHVRQLAAGGGAGQTVDVGFLGPLEKLPLFKTLNPENWLNPKGAPPVLESEKKRVEQGGLSGLEAVGTFFSALLSAEFWLRALEVLGGAVLVYLGLKSLTGVELPSVVPVPV